MAEENTAEELTKMPRHRRYYALHREEKLAKERERYNNNPQIIAKRQEKERKKAEKEAEIEAKRIERERIRQENLALALATKQKNTKEDGGLSELLDSRPA